MRRSCYWSTGHAEILYDADRGAMVKLLTEKISCDAATVPRNTRSRQMRSGKGTKRPVTLRTLCVS